jgi:hypothetical protein
MDNMSRKEMCTMLCSMGYEMQDLEVCSDAELVQMCNGMNHEIVENQSTRIIKSFKDFR